MPSVADFNHEPSRNAAQTTPDAYALELGRAWYERQRGEPHPFILRELGAQMLFAHLFQCAGARGLWLSRAEDTGVIMRSRATNPILIGPPDTDPYTIKLLETSYMIPSEGTWRGVTPGLGFHDKDGKSVFVHTRRPLMAMDWMVNGPFLPPSNGYALLEAMATELTNFMAYSRQAQSISEEVPSMVLWEEQRLYVEELENAADVLGIGRPQMGLDTSGDFISPLHHDTEGYLNPN
jgi:hypothetical protein